MHKRRSKSVKVVTATSRLTNVWVLGGVLVVVGLAAVTFKVMRSSTPAPAPAAASTSVSFLPTIANTIPRPSAAPEGMVWIPGGEFSMGAQDPPDMHDAVGMQATTDSRPIHRVFVDGFWMDATEVTNAAVRGVRAGYRVCHGGRARAPR